jgi:2'-deoxynucleoside 5'-phosphate N-hydrolase
MARIYFSGSITGGRDDVPLYQTIIEALKAEGHEVLAGAVASETVSAAGEALSREEIFERDIRWIEEVAAAGGALVAEVSMPSIGVGYEIAYARHRRGMRVICLWRPAYTRRCSAMIAGDGGIELLEYTDDAVDDMLSDLVGRLRE